MLLLEGIMPSFFYSFLLFFLLSGMKTAVGAISRPD